MKKIITFFIFLSIISYSETISQIQGDGFKSKYENKNVQNVEGIVTNIYKNKYNSGFYMQSEETKKKGISNGIWVETKKNVKIGDKVIVSGKVKEIQFSKFDAKNPTETAIVANGIYTVSSNNSVKPYILKEIPKSIPDAVKLYESLEGMLVQLDKPLIIGKSEKYSEIFLAYGDVKDRTNNGGIRYSYENEQPSRLRYVKGLNEKIDISRYNIGDVVKDKVLGNMSFHYGMYTIRSNNFDLDVIKSNLSPEKVKYVHDKSKLSMISYNVENFSRFDKEKLEKLAYQIVNVFGSPDILGLVEIEDDDSDKMSNVTSSYENAMAIINEVVKQKGIRYGYIAVDPKKDSDGGKPGVNIRNIILYRQDTLKLVAADKGTYEKDTEMKNSKLIYNPGRIGNNDKAFENSRKPLIAHFKKGEKDLFIILNHFNSKRSDTMLWGEVQPQNRKSEIQRNEQARIVRNFMDSILKQKPNALIAVMGDLNDYEFSNTVKILQKDDFISSAYLVDIKDRHSYVHEGGSQVLDHIIINKKYSNSAHANFININSEFGESQGRISDHDPVYLNLDF